MQEAKKSIQEALDNCVYINYDTSQLRIKVQNTLAALKMNPNYQLKLSSDKPIRLKDDPRDFKKHLKYIVWSAQQKLPKKSQRFKNLYRQFEKKEEVDVGLLQQELSIYKKLSETKDQSVTVTFLQKQVFELTQQLQKQSETLTKQKSENVCLSFKAAKLEASQKQKDVQFTQMQRQLQGKVVQHNLLLEDVKQREQLQVQLNEQTERDHAAALQQLRDQNLQLEKKLKAEIHELQNVIRGKDDQIKQQTLQFTAEKHLLTEQIELMRKDNIKIREIQQEDQRTLQKMTIELDTKQQQVTQMKINFNEQLQEYKNTISQLKKQPTQEVNLKVQSRSSKREDSMMGTVDNDPDHDIYTLTQQNQQLKYDYAVKDQQCQKLAKEIQIRTQQLQRLQEQRKLLEEQVSHLRLELDESSKREAQYASRDDAIMIQNQKQIIQNLQQDVKDLKSMLARQQNNDRNGESQQNTIINQDSFTPKMLHDQQKSRTEEKQIKSPLLQDMTLLLSPQRQQNSRKMTLQELNHENQVLWSENQRLKAQLQKQRDMLVQKELEAGIQSMNTRAQQTRLAKNSFLKPILKAQDLPYTQINLPHKNQQNPQIKINQAKIIKADQKEENSNNSNTLQVLGPVSSQENSEAESNINAYQLLSNKANEISANIIKKTNNITETEERKQSAEVSGQKETKVQNEVQEKNNIENTVATQQEENTNAVPIYNQINTELIEAQTV